MKRVTIFVFLLLITFTVPMYSDVQAQTVMKTGTITKTPWLNRHYKVRIDGVLYTFMPEVQIDGYFTDYEPQKMSSYLAGKFRVGDKVSIAKQGFRIYRIEFLEK